MPNAWTDKELALLKQLVQAHVDAGGAVDEVFARAVESRLPRHPWSGVLRKLHTLGYRARAFPRNIVSETASPECRLSQFVEHLTTAVDNLRQVIEQKL